MLIDTASMRNAFAPGALAGCRVLVAEDDYFLAADIMDVLHSASADVVGPVPTLAETLAQLRNQVDAAVLDIGLRGTLAWPAAEVLMAKQVPFVFATGYGLEVVPPAYAGVPHWVKPLDTSRLVNTLSALIRSRGVSTMA